MQTICYRYAKRNNQTNREIWATTGRTYMAEKNAFLPCYSKTKEKAYIKPIDLEKAKPSYRWNKEIGNYEQNGFSFEWVEFETKEVVDSYGASTTIEIDYVYSFWYNIVEADE